MSGPALQAYITAIGKYLPGTPVPNDEIEEYIGSVGAATSTLKDRVLKNSGIRTRHYAIDKDQRTRISNAGMATNAIREAVERSPAQLEDVDLLAVATTINDLIAPGIASMVHGELASPPCEIVSLHGICSCGMMALKSAYHHVILGEKQTAVACASELPSRVLKSSRFGGVDRVDDDGNIAMEMAFLRYMLSDGAGAAVIQSAPREGRNYRIEWISLTSYANTADACMYMGSNTSSCATTWADYETVADAMDAGALALRQNLALLPRVVEVGVEEYARLLRKGLIAPDRIRYVAAHYSSEIMRPAVVRELEKRGCATPPADAWYTNLHSVGNVGCAAIYIILEELDRVGDLRDGDQILCFVPESGRLSISYMLLTVVDG